MGTTTAMRELIRWHEHRASDWSFAVPPEGDYERCGDCGRPESDHPTPNVMLVPELHRAFVALLEVAEAAERISFPSNTVGEFTVDGFAGAQLKAALDRLTDH